MVDRAGDVERELYDPADADLGIRSFEHFGYVLSAILVSGAFLESLVNELYQDAHDLVGHDREDSYIYPLGENSIRRLGLLWSATNEGTRLRPLEKYQFVLLLADRPTLDEGAQPYQDAQLVIQLRNEVAHYQPDFLGSDVPAEMEQKLRGKFSSNRLMEEARGPWWPYQCLGHGCAEWSWRSALAFADHFCEVLSISPQYKRLSHNPGGQPTKDEET